MSNSPGMKLSDLRRAESHSVASRRSTTSALPMRTHLALAGVSEAWPVAAGASLVCRVARTVVVARPDPNRLPNG